MVEVEDKYDHYESKSNWKKREGSLYKIKCTKLLSAVIFLEERGYFVPNLHPLPHQPALKNSPPQPNATPTSHHTLK
ncbi:hypothetical protein GBA52_002948 [Prunus armeniaca]|nr:hypothetical protein GBA52_002948 [Prunus armeniaca]